MEMKRRNLILNSNKNQLKRILTKILKNKLKD
jgi:hypothetical protein